MELTVAADTSVTPDAAPVGGTPGYLTSGNPGSAIAASVLPGYQVQAIVDEILAIIAAGGLTPDRTNTGQAIAAIRNLIGAVPGGFANILYNAPMHIWSRGTSGTITAGATGAYTVDGTIVTCTGANVTWSQVAGLGLTKWALAVTGAVGTTNTTVKRRIESLYAWRVASQPVTVRYTVQNNTGASITPVLTVNHPTSSDNYGAVSTDVSSQALQPIAAGATVTISRTFNASASSTNGLEVIIDFGAVLNSVAKNIVICEGDVRATPGLVVGLQANPQPVEIRPVSIEELICQRYLPAVTPGSSSGISTGAMQTSTQADIPIRFRVKSRVAPTAMTVSDPSHFTMTLSGTNKTVTAIAFIGAGVEGATITVTDANDTWAAQDATMFTSANSAASLLFTGAEL